MLLVPERVLAPGGIFYIGSGFVLRNSGSKKYTVLKRRLNLDSVRFARRLIRSVPGIELCSRMSCCMRFLAMQSGSVSPSQYTFSFDVARGTPSALRMSGVKYVQYEAFGCSKVSRMGGRAACVPAQCCHASKALRRGNTPTIDLPVDRLRW